MQAMMADSGHHVELGGHQGLSSQEVSAVPRGPWVSSCGSLQHFVFFLSFLRPVRPQVERRRAEFGFNGLLKPT